ncbi:MAG: hypothetical protein Q8L85_04660 [Alphaproteobacteria bacterium]|nr:hypothetical protein [Alphaproteobacteria bacterium]
MNQFKIALFLLSVFTFTQPLSASDDENFSLDDEYIEDSDGFETSSDDETTDSQLQIVFKDYINMRGNFQSHWGFTRSNYDSISNNWIRDFFDNKFKIKYTINENGTARKESNYFKDISENDLDLIEGILENKVIFYHWLNDKIKESSYNSNDLNSIFLTKKISKSWKKHLYINGLAKHYLYNHRLLDLLCKTIKDTFTDNIEMNYCDERGNVKLCDLQETNLSKVRTILRQIEQDLKNDNDLQKCFEVKKHPIKNCSKSCLHTYFKDIDASDLHRYYNLSLGRFNLLEKVFGVETIKKLTDNIEFYTQEIQEDVSEIDLDSLIADLPKIVDFPKKEKSSQKKKSKNSSKKRKGKKTTTESKKTEKNNSTDESNPAPSQARLPNQSDFQIILPNGELFDCPQQHIIKEDQQEKKKKKGFFEKIKEKAHQGIESAQETINLVQNAAQFIQHPQEEMRVLMQRIDGLLHHQSSLQRLNAEMRGRLEYESQKLKETESAKAEIEEKYIGLKEQLDHFESQKKEQERKLRNLEKATNDATSYVQKLETLSSNTLSEADALRAYADAISLQTHAIIQHNHGFAFLLNQYQEAYTMQSQYLRQIDNDRRALLAENERLRNALAKKKE